MKRVILLLLFPLLSFADPGGATQYLINDPVSMMDIGIFRAERDLDIIIQRRNKSYEKRRDLSLTALSGFVSYLYEDDLIVLSAELNGAEPIAKTLEDECRLIVELMRTRANILAEVWFSHAGFKRSGEPKDLADKIKDRIQLRCDGASAYLGDNNRSIVSARSMLLEKQKVFVTRKSEQ